ncbi:MAG: hypothetical protein QNJ63_20725 [Calothrix sp. MO_192.B10]|nr:hypothetical protein [Calothrix sp. MO_192.B10]
MTKLSFDQFIHPLSEFPQVVNIAEADEPMLDLYTMAGVILYTACAHENQKAKTKALEASAVNAGLVDVNLLFKRCQRGDRGAILEMISLMVAGMENSFEEVKTV